ncbi:hypothetical protein J6590_081062 [Homalodisca vitripennis]|nr:hypothetical protein J6590_081062 [Homalodisca vitripennis]
MGWRYLGVSVNNLMRQLDLCLLVERFDFTDLVFLYKLVKGISYCSALLAKQPTNVKTSRREVSRMHRHQSPILPIATCILALKTGYMKACSSGTILRRFDDSNYDSSGNFRFFSRSSSLSQSSFSSPTTPCYYSPPQAYAAGHVQPAQFRTPSPPSPRRHIRTPSPPSPMSTPSPRHYRREHASPRVLFPSPSPPQMFSSPSSQSSYSSSWPSSPSQSPDSTYPSPPRHGRPNVCRTPGEATPPPSPPPPRRCPRAPQRSPETTPPSRGYADRRSPGNPPRRRYAPRRLPFSDQCDSPDSTTAPLPPRQVAYREPPGEAMARPTNPNFIRRVVSLRRRLQIMHRNLPRHWWV